MFHQRLRLEPDPAPPPRGLKHVPRREKPRRGCGGARPRPNSEGIETETWRSPSSSSSGFRARPRPNSEGIETLYRRARSIGHLLGARPRPTSEGIETKQEGVEQGLPDGPARPRPTSEGIETRWPRFAPWPSACAGSPTPPHLRGD